MAKRAKAPPQAGQACLAQTGTWDDETKTKGGKGCAQDVEMRAQTGT
jgi:hypothetical protein